MPTIDSPKFECRRFGLNQSLRGSRCDVDSTSPGCRVSQSSSSTRWACALRMEIVVACTSLKVEIISDSTSVIGRARKSSNRSEVSHNVRPPQNRPIVAGILHKMNLSVSHFSACPSIYFSHVVPPRVRGGRGGAERARHMARSFSPPHGGRKRGHLVGTAESFCC